MVGFHLHGSVLSLVDPRNINELEQEEAEEAENFFPVSALSACSF